MNLKQLGIEVVSFDIGNTLINLEGVPGFCTYFCQTTGLNVNDIRSILNDYFLKRNADIRDSVKLVCEHLNIKNYNSIIQEYINVKKKPTVYADVFDTLIKLKKDGYRIIACSNCTKWDANDSDIGIHPYFDDIFYSFEIGYAKPEMDFFKYVSCIIQVDVLKILHVGDSLNADYFAAREAGWNSVLLDRNDRCDDSAIQKIQSLSELLN